MGFVVEGETCVFGSCSAGLQEYYFLLIFVYSEAKGGEKIISPEARTVQNLRWHYDLCNCREHVAEYAEHPRNSGLLMLNRGCLFISY